MLAMPLWLMLAAVATSALAQSQASPADWTQFHRDNMQRWNPYETVLDVNNVGGLQVKWKAPSNIGESLWESSPAVANGVVYFGADDGNLYALSASSGSLLWSYNTGHPVTSSPAVANGVVYFGSNASLYALNVTTGAKLWSYTTGGLVDSSPAVANGVVYIGSDNVYALDASTGAKLWSYPIGTPNFIDSSPAVANGVVYIGVNESEELLALSASSGALLWSYTTGNFIDSSPAVANGVVYFGSLDGNMYALNASTGAKLWTLAIGVEVASSPAIANGVVYIGSAFGVVYAANASTGAPLWKTYIGDSIGFPSPAIANGVVYVSSGKGTGNGGFLYALNASTGARLWGSALGAISSSPTIVDGVLYFRSGNTNQLGYTYAFGLGSSDLFLRINPSTTTVHQGDLLTYAFPVWNLGPDNAFHEVVNTEVPAGTTFDYIRISGTPGLGTCTTPPYGGTGKIVCNENAAMAPNTTWTVRLTVKVTAPTGSLITTNAATVSDTPDPNMANNTATVSLTVQ